MELHISRKCRVKYDLGQSNWSPTGKLQLENLQQIRQLVKKINDRRDMLQQPGDFATAAELFAMGLINEIIRLVTGALKQDADTTLFAGSLERVEQKIGSKRLTDSLIRFTEEFPLDTAAGAAREAGGHAAKSTPQYSPSESTLEEMLYLWLANGNPAFTGARELFDDSQLRSKSDYTTIIEEIKRCSDSGKGLGTKGQNLIALLREPVIFSPDSLSGQLQYIATNWDDLLRRVGFDFSRLLLGRDVLREEEKYRGAGPGPAEVITYADDGEERFSSDSHWMPRLVMMAKNILVWLDQLSNKYSRTISRLDQIPDEELDLLAARGFSGLWLIGLWERSPASRRIKQLCGNPEAAASAYSLKAYRPAAALGGYPALEDLKKRCQYRGIRLACDMVPNHTGLDSTWIIEHPEWFISRPDCPYPNYSFSGENLSGCGEISVSIEDHYYDRTDAAVVFKREDLRTGEIQYIYHGNDGTSMPWNDTAQLNYLNHNLRQAVMKIILEVARLFPIIRFDAAMTLAKRHYRRLWFPEPGSGGDIPTRAEFSLPKTEFERAFPVEFWREVADRIAVEAPGTLLLAEAFWMMEGYFVRNLGMHRVYNSAFMNMLKMEENGKFRKLLKNTLEFDPEILKRYVNFMSNPDEESAASQFGRDDKYFGVCVLMTTLPGLPMFAHGQIEGFEEKYGMEYTRAYWQEQENEQLIKSHENVIFPLLHKRRHFAGAENFYLFDLYTSGGIVDENVIAYSNSWQGEKNLVVYNNGYNRTAGWIKISAARLEKNSSGSAHLQQKELGAILELAHGADKFVIFRDTICGKEYLHPADELIKKGLYLELEGYGYHVFMEFRQVSDSSLQIYRALCQQLEGKGVANIETAVSEYLLPPVHNAFRKFFSSTMLKYFIPDYSETTAREAAAGRPVDPGPEGREFLSQMEKFSGRGAVEAAQRHLAEDLASLKQLRALTTDTTQTDLPAVSALRKIRSNSCLKALMVSWICTRELSEFLEDKKAGISLLQMLCLGPVLETLFREFDLTGQDIRLAGKLLPVMMSIQDLIEEIKQGCNSASALFRSLFKRQAVRELLEMHACKDEEYFDQAAFEALTQVMYFMVLFRLLKGNPKITTELLREFEHFHGLYLDWCRAGSAAGYLTAQFLSKLKGTL